MVETSSSSTAVDARSSKKIWASLVTNTNYLPGLLTLEYSLRAAGSKYPLVALYTDTFPEEGHKALKARGIPSRRIARLSPSVSQDYTNDPRFHECWTKLAQFGLTDYDRVVQLDSDMLALQNMDELMDMELDGPEQNGDGQRVFAASHACACNPLKKAHYPKDYIPENCAFTSQHSNPDQAQETGALPSVGVGSLNGGLLVIVPSKGASDKIMEALSDGTRTSNYYFADQALLSDVFGERWVGLPYIYNALKTMRAEDVHGKIWRDERVKNVHIILSPKPWEEKPGESPDVTHGWWHEMTARRFAEESAKGIKDGF